MEDAEGTTSKAGRGSHLYGMGFSSLSFVCELHRASKGTHELRQHGHQELLLNRELQYHQGIAPVARDNLMHFSRYSSCAMSRYTASYSTSILLGYNVMMGKREMQTCRPQKVKGCQIKTSTVPLTKLPSGANERLRVTKITQEFPQT